MKRHYCFQFLAGCLFALALNPAWAYDHKFSNYTRYTAKITLDQKGGKNKHGTCNPFTWTKIDGTAANIPNSFTVDLLDKEKRVLHTFKFEDPGLGDSAFSITCVPIFKPGTGQNLTREGINEWIVQVFRVEKTGLKRTDERSNFVKVFNIPLTESK